MRMKDKKAKQREDRKRHKERRKDPLLQVAEEPQILEKPTILIVCDGKNTEPSYFKQFKLSSATVEPVGDGNNTVTTVKQAIELSEKKTYDQVWCVFDADPKPDSPQQLQNFNDAIKLAEKNNFGIAYSNQAFEYWIILHFNDHQGGRMPRSDYDGKINAFLKPFGVTFEGKGNKIITEDIFDLLEGIDEQTGKVRRKLAVKRAKRNYNLLDHANPANEESSTTVFRLVEELTKYV